MVEIRTSHSTNNRLRFTKNTTLPAVLPDPATWNDDPFFVLFDDPINDAFDASDMFLFVVVVLLLAVAVAIEIETKGFFRFIIGCMTSACMILFGHHQQRLDVLLSLSVLVFTIVAWQFDWFVPLCWMICERTVLRCVYGNITVEHSIVFVTRRWCLTRNCGSGRRKEGFFSREFGSWHAQHLCVICLHVSGAQ